MGAPRLGILMLDTAFPRIPGDIGNPASWPFAVRIKVVPGASPQAAVLGDPLALAEPFIAAGHALVAEGCTAIATTCGFLVPLRRHLAAALGVTVATSALEQVPLVQATLPRGQRVGIVTISAAAITAAHLDAAGIAPGTPIQGTDGGSFSRDILGNRTTLDTDAARAEIVAASRTLVAGHPDIGAIVLECTNMPPYAADVARATGRPVYSIHSYLTWIMAAQMPPIFGPG